MSRPIHGTLVETYLRRRGITSLHGTGSLRFHPRCYYRPDEHSATETWPAMIAAVTDLDGRLTGAHRTWLDPDGFEILREERDRDRAIYDGRLTAIHQMRDVRVGDIVHFAYTKTGANPVFGGHFSRNIALGWSTPARQFRTRVVHPADRPLHFVLRGENAPAPVVRPLPGGLAELRWEAAPLPAVVAEGRKH